MSSTFTPDQEIRYETSDICNAILLTLVLGCMVQMYRRLSHRIYRLQEDGENQLARWHWTVGLNEKIRDINRRMDHWAGSNKQTTDGLARRVRLADKKDQELETRLITLEETWQKSMEYFHADLVALGKDIVDLGKDLVELEESVNARFEKLTL